jgi:hypothetical protein
VVTTKIPPWYGGDLGWRAYGRAAGRTDGPHGAQRARATRGKNEAPLGAGRPREVAGAWDGVQPRKGALARMPRRTARATLRRNWRSSRNHFKLSDFEHDYLPKIVLKCTKR